MTTNYEQTTPNPKPGRPRAIGFVALIAAAIVLATAGVAAAASSNSRPDETASIAQEAWARSTEDCSYKIAVASGASSEGAAAAMSERASSIVEHGGNEISVADDLDRTHIGVMFGTATYVTIEIDAAQGAEVLDAIKDAIEEDDDWWLDDEVDLTAEFAGEECDFSRFDHDDFSVDDLANTHATVDLDTGDGKCQLKSHIGEDGFDWKDFDFGDLSLDIDDENDTFTISLDSDQAQISFGCSDS